MTPEQASSPKWGERQLRLAIDAAGVALWSWNVDDDTFAMDERAFAFWGLAHSEPRRVFRRRFGLDHAAKACAWVWA